MSEHRLSSVRAVVVGSSFLVAGLTACGSGALLLGERASALGSSDAGEDASEDAAGNTLFIDGNVPSPRCDGAPCPDDAGPIDAGPLACAETVATACGGDGGIPTPICGTWTQALAACTAFESVKTCGPYDVLHMLGVDTSTDSYYDHATGQLVAVVISGVGSEYCAEGPATFTPPACGPLSACP